MEIARRVLGVALVVAPVGSWRRWVGAGVPVALDTGDERRGLLGIEPGAEDGGHAGELLAFVFTDRLEEVMLDAVKDQGRGFGNRGVKRSDVVKRSHSLLVFQRREQSLEDAAVAAMRSGHADPRTSI